MHFNANGNGIGVIYHTYYMNSHGGLKFFLWGEFTRHQSVEAEAWIKDFSEEGVHL